MSKEGGVAEWSLTHSSCLEYSKLALIDFAHRSSTQKRTTLKIPWGEVQPVESTKYLGVILNQQLNWKAQHAYTIEKGTKWVAQIQRIAKPTWGITPKYMRKLYIGVVLPRILYVVDLWCTPSCNKHAGSKSKGPIKVMKQITTIQRGGALAMTGALQTLPTDYLDACTYLLPTTSIISKWCLRAMTHMAMLLPEHLLYKTIMHKGTQNIKQHCAPINNLLASTDMDMKRFEKIPTTTCNLEKTRKLPFGISIPKDRDSSKEEAENMEEEVQIYLDGSAINGKVGAAVVLIRPGQPECTLHYHLGPDSEHTVYEAKLVGILLGIHLVKTEKKGNTSFAIGVDN